MLPLLIDRLAYKDNLQTFGLDETWLDETLKEKGLRRKDVMIYLYNGKDSLLVTKKTAHNGRS